MSLPGMMGVIMAGGATGTVSFSGATASHTSGGVASASITFKANGQYSKTEGGVETVLGNWIDPQLRMHIHQIRFTNLVNVEPTVTGGTDEDEWWVFADGDFSLSLIQTFTTGGQSSTFDVEIRLGENDVIDTAEFTISVTKT